MVNSSGDPDQAPLAAYGRDAETGVQVWSGEHGYPGDEWYLEFHKKLVEEKARSLGLRYWRISQDKADIGSKRLYEPHRAAARVKEHASHFSELVKNVLAAQMIQHPSFAQSMIPSCTGIGGLKAQVSCMK